MTTTREEIRGWLAGAARLGATHLIVACDRFDQDDFSISVMPGEDVVARVAHYSNPDQMLSVMEVYALHLDLEGQLAEHRAYHVDYPSRGPTVQKKEPFAMPTPLKNVAKKISPPAPPASSAESLKDKLARVDAMGRKLSEEATAVTRGLVEIETLLVASGIGVEAEIALPEIGGEGESISLAFMKGPDRWGLYVFDATHGSGDVPTPVKNASKPVRIAAAKKLHALLDAVLLLAEREQRDMGDALASIAEIAELIERAAPARPHD